MIAVSTWAEFEREAPALAEVAAGLWPGAYALARNESPLSGGPSFAIAYLATVRPDGSPRVHPFCPILAGGRLFAAIPRRSPKGWDLRRDPRCVIHAMPGPEDDELCIQALARDVSMDAAAPTVVRETVLRSGVGGMIESTSRDPIFEFNLRQVDVARWKNIGQPRTYAVRQQWRTG
jgi:hypothetical protein